MHNKMAQRQPTQREKLPELKYDWNLLGNARIAAEYLKGGEKGLPFVKKSLELILKDAKIQDPWILQTLTDPEVINKTINSQLESYGQYKGEQTVGDLLKYYSTDMSKYLGGNAEIALKELSKFKREKYSDIVKKIEKEEYIIEGKEFGRSSDEEVKAAKKTIEKYQKASLTFNLLEGLSLGKFRMRVEEEVTKDGLRELYRPKESKE